MKSLIKPLALSLSLALTTAFTAFAADRPALQPTVGVAYKAGVHASANGRLVIALDKQTGGSVTIRLSDQKGNVLYSQHVRKNEQTSRVRLDLNELADGVYNLVITNGVDATRQTITIDTQRPTTPERVILTQAVLAAN